MALTQAVYRLTGQFPDSERFGLISQMRRCAVSIPSNIAEGHARFSTREFIHHISIAVGSLAELETQLQLGNDLGFAEKHATSILLSQSDQLGKMLRSLTKSLKQRLNEGK